MSSRMKPLRDVLLLLIACTALYVPGSGSIPLYTRGEPREAQVVRTVASGGARLVPIRPNGKLTRKPPLYYWVGAVAWRALPTAPERAVRLPSIVGGTIGVLATYATASLAVGASAAMPAAIVLATSFEWLRASTRARLDMTLAASMALVLLAWTGAVMGHERWPTILAACALTVATLTKGPVALVLAAPVAVVTWGLHRRDVPAAPFMLSIATAIVLSGLWYAAAWSQHGSEFTQVVMRENLGRFVDASGTKAGHEHGIAYLGILGLIGLLPWTLLLPVAVASGRATRRSPAGVLLVAWSLVTPLFFALSSGKRGVYLLPAYPAIAVLLGAGVAHAQHGAAARATRLLAAAYRPALLLLGGLLLSAAIGLDPTGLVRPLLTSHDAEVVAGVVAGIAAQRWVVVVVACALLAAGLAIERGRRRDDVRSMVMTLGGLVLIATMLFQSTLHPMIGRQQSLAGFLATLDPLLAPDEIVYAQRPVDPEVGYYTPRTVRPWPREGHDHATSMLIWEDTLLVTDHVSGAPLQALARSERKHGHRGALVLVQVPPGPISFPAMRARSEGVVDASEHREPLVGEPEVDEGQDLRPHDTTDTETVNPM